MSPTQQIEIEFPYKGLQMIAEAKQRRSTKRMLLKVKWKRWEDDEYTLCALQTYIFPAKGDYLADYNIYVQLTAIFLYLNDVEKPA